MKRPIRRFAHEALIVAALAAGGALGAWGQQGPGIARPNGPAGMGAGGGEPVGMGPGAGGPGFDGGMPPLPPGFFHTSGTLTLPPALEHFAAEEFPDVRSRLERGPGRLTPAERMELLTFLQHMMDLKQGDPERYAAEKAIHQLEAKSVAMSAALRNKPDDQRAKQQEELADVLGQLFDLREKKREMEAQQIEAELKHVRTILEQRLKNREAIIQKRLDELTGSAEALDW
jgi:hypothetical protein